MGSIAVTGATSAVGWRLCRQLAADPDVHRVVGLDWTEPANVPAKVETHAIDPITDDATALLGGCSTLVHLAEEAADPETVDQTTRVLHRWLEQCQAVGVHRVVLLSSATVYGAHADNPVPITESQLTRPSPQLSFAMAKWDAEQELGQWVAADTQRSSCILRPATTLSERGAGWVARAVRAAATMRPEQVDPPVQFLHHDDLSSALSLAARRPMSGVYNVAADGWIGTEVFRDLVGGVPVRLPVALADRARRMSRRYGVRPTPPGIEDYVTHPWVIANDKLRAEGWVPAFSNEEAYVLGTPPPPWAMSAQRRQEVALGAAGLGVAGAAAVIGGLARRLTR